MSEKKYIPLVETPYVTALAKDYLLGKDLGGLNPGEPSEENLLKKIADKRFDVAKRGLLVNALLNQYERDEVKLTPDSEVYKNIQLLNAPNTYTFTTGQQIHIFLGPLFFIYKIQSLLRHVKSTQSYSGIKIVPVFWMATEDHDLEEINYVKLYGETFKWDAPSGNAVGRISCSGLPELIDAIETRADKTEVNKAMFHCFRSHYKSDRTLAAATRSLLHDLFKEEGLIIIDPDDKTLKSTFFETAKKEMENRILFQTVKDQNLSLKKSGYEPRINPQEINFFWLEENKRSKLRVKDKKVVIDNTDVEVTLMQMESTPEKLSPNVMARPLYQESILPNVLYLGGSAEVEYWLPLQAAFDLCNLQYPILMQRDSNLMISKKNLEVLEKSGFEWSDLFKPEKDIAAQYFERDAHVSDKLTKIVDTITSELVSLNKELEKERKGSTSIYKDLHELQKGVAKLSRNISEEVLLSQKQNPELNRVLKIKTKFFDTKQERDEYTLSYPQILDSPNNDLSGMTAYLAIHST